MLKEKLRNFKAIYLLYVLLFALLVACVVLFIQNHKMTKTIKSIYGTGFSGVVRDREFTKEYNKLIRDYDKKMDELMEIQRNLLDRDTFDDFYNDNWRNGWEDCRRRHWGYYDDFDDFRNYHHNEMRRHYNRLNRQRPSRDMRNIDTRDARVFNYNSKIERNKDNFVLRVKIPKIFTLDDVKVDFRNRNLLVKIEKENETKDKNEERKTYNSFFESFLVPETKAKLADVKVSLNKDNDNELVVIVPIL